MDNFNQSSTNVALLCESQRQTKVMEEVRDQLREQTQLLREQTQLLREQKVADPPDAFQSVPTTPCTPHTE